MAVSSVPLGDPITVEGLDEIRRRAVSSSGGYCFSSRRDGGDISHREKWADAERLGVLHQ